MSPKPSDRPSAREVLRSDLLPPLVEDEQVADLVRSLPNNPNTYERVVEAIFACSPSAAPGLPQAGSGPPPDSAGAGAAGQGAGQGELGPLALGELPGAPVNLHVEVRDAVTRVVHEVFRWGR